MRRVSAGLVVWAVTPPLQPGLDHLGGDQGVVLAALQSPQLLPGRAELLHHLLQPLGNLGLSHLAAADPLSGNNNKISGKINLLKFQARQIKND